MQITGSSVSVQIGIENTVPELKTKLSAALQENVDECRVEFRPRSKFPLREKMPFGLRGRVFFYLK